MGRKIFAALVALAFVYIAWPLMLPVAMGGVFAVLFSPGLDLLEKKGVSLSLSSTLMTMGITLIFILPTSFLFFFVAKTGFTQLQVLRRSPHSGTGFMESVMATPRVHSWMLWVTRRFPLTLNELSDTFQELMGSLGAKLTELLGGFLTQLPGLVVSIVVVVVSIYFFLIDGRRLIHFIRRNSLFTSQETEQLIQTVAEMCRSVILAAVVSGAMQALLEVLSCVLTATPNAALIGLLVFVASFVPLVGSSPITLAVGVQQLLEGRQVTGVTLLIMAIVIIGVDNTVRPLFLKGSANLHPLLAFVAAFGGLQTVGFLGVFLGPILAALFVMTIQILSHKDSEREAG